MKEDLTKEDLTKEDLEQLESSIEVILSAAKMHYAVASDEDKAEVQELVEDLVKNNTGRIASMVGGMVLGFGVSVEKAKIKTLMLFYLLSQVAEKEST